MSPNSNHSATVGKILGLLENLLQTPEGRALYRRIEDGFRCCQALSASVESAFVGFLATELKRYLALTEADPATRMVVKLVQRRLSAFVDEDTAPSPAGGEAIPGFDAADAESLQQQLLAALSNMVPPSAGGGQAPDAGEPDPGRNLSRRRRQLEQIQEELEGTLSGLAQRNRDFLSNLRTIRMAIHEVGRHAPGPDMQMVLLEGIDEILASLQAMESELNAGSEALKSMRSENIALHEEIVKVRQLTLADELTGLPNRLALSRQLEAEIRRVQRHRLPLVLAILSIDRFDERLRRHGREAGDRILKSYAEYVFSFFRGYDLVARVGEGRFAVLLPNTSIEGATRALIEAQHRAGQSVFRLGDEDHGLPGFSTGVAVYEPNESAEAFLARAEAALEQASLAGHKRLQVAAQRSVGLPAGAAPGRPLH